MGLIRPNFISALQYPSRCPEGSIQTRRHSHILWDLRFLQLNYWRCAFLPCPHTPLNEAIISFAVLNDHADALDILDKEFERAVPADLARHSNNTQEISNMIKKFYFADQHVSEETLLQFVNVSMRKQLQIKFRINCLSCSCLKNCKD